MGYSEFSRVSVEKPDRDVSQVSTVPKVISQRLLARYKYDEGTCHVDSECDKGR